MQIKVYPTQVRDVMGHPVEGDGECLFTMFDRSVRWVIALGLRVDGSNARLVLRMGRYEESEAHVKCS